MGTAVGNASLSGSARAYFVPTPIGQIVADCDIPGLRPEFREGFPTTWDSNPAQTFEGLKIGPQIRGFHQAKLQHMGYPAELWQPVTDGPVCSCVKETSQAGIRDCPSCHGVGKIPGFNKFLHKVTYFDVSEFNEFASTDGVRIDRTTKPNKVVLNEGSLTGVFYTQLKILENGPIPQDWQVDVQCKKSQGGAVNVEFTTDGINYFPITRINGPNRPIGATTIQLRVTIRRFNVRQRSPEFYIVRIRRLMYENCNFAAIKSRECVGKKLRPGEILVLWDWQQTTPVSNESLGFVRDEGKKIWTAPLDYFDISLDIDTPECAIFDLQSGPHPFIKFSTGIEQDHVFALTQGAYSEQMQVFSHQSFMARKPQKDSETYYKVRDGFDFDYIVILAEATGESTMNSSSEGS